MSIYTSLGFPVPIISYTILHRARPDVGAEEYRRTMVEMHRRVEAETASLAEQHARAIAEISNRQAQILRGALSQFLETPIRSDDAEVQKIFGENLDKFREQISEAGPWGVFASLEGALVGPSGGGASLKRLETNGRRYLRALGLASGKAPGSFYESLYVIRGAENLDVIEHIVRDRLGIYGPTHGKHIAESADFTVAAHNLIHAAGADYWKTVRSAWGECTLVFSKPHIPYDDFRGALSSVIESAVAASGIPASTLWQRKLGLGRGGEFSIRLLLDERAQLGEIIERIGALKEPSFLKSTLLGRGSLLLKELLYPRNA